MGIIIAVLFAGVVVGWMVKTAFAKAKVTTGPVSGGQPTDETPKGPINEQ